jgi:CHAT domain-containing protein/Flp pilus assembly protein TadD
MFQSFFLPYVMRRRRKNRRMTTLFALTLIARVALCSGHADDRTTFVELKPKQIQTLPITLEKGQVARVQLHVEGGLMGVRANSPGANERPILKIDMGRGAKVTYIVGGSGAGVYSLELSSLEQEKLARISVEIDPPTPVDAASIDLRDAEDALADADLVRNRAKSARPGLDALKSYDRALMLATKIGNTPLMRLVLTQKARFLIFRLNKFEDARVLLEQAVALPPANDVAQQALAWKTLSTVRYDLGEYQPAIKASMTSLDLYRSTGDLYWQGIVLGNLSSDYEELGQADDALAAAKEALRDAEQERDPAGVVYCLAEVANLYRQQGDLEGALHTFHEGLELVGHVDYAPLVEAEIQKDLGHFYAQIGDWEQASLALQRCVELEGKQNDPVSLEARGILADVMQHQGRLRDAVAQDTTAIEVARALALKHEESALLLKRASAQMLLKRPAEAKADIEAATQLAVALSAVPLQIEAAVVSGDAQLVIDAKAAEDSFRKALQLAEHAGEREQQSVALAGLARAQQREGNLEDATTSIAAALKILEASRSSLGSRELQVTYFAMHRSWYELAVDLCMQLHTQHPSRNYALLAFDYTERARARSLLDTLYASGYTLSAPVPEDLREASARNRQAISDQQSLLSHSTDQSSNDAAAKLQRLYHDQETLEAEMQSSDHRLTSLLASQTVDIPLLQHRLLEDRSVLLSYWIGNSHSYRWTITSNNVLVDALPSRDELERTILPLERMLQTRRSALVPGEDIATYAAHQQAYEVQLQNALNRAGSTLLSRIPKTTHSIFIVSDGSLMSLPFAALRIPNGTSTSYAIRRYTFFVEPSASVAAYLKQHPAAEQPLRIAVFADPVFSRNDPRVAATPRLTLTANSRLLFANMPRLTGSREEARQIVHLAPTGTVVLRTGFDATPEQINTLKPTDASILHFATHTVTVAGHPEISGIALSMVNREGKEQDGIFWLKDIYELHLPLSLVVLSGCTTDNLGNDTGEGLNSIARAFFFSGVHSVIGSLWTVDDRASSQLMQSFYRNLLVDHKRADEALRSAQLKLLADPQTSSPAAWAPFILDGWPAAYATTAKDGDAIYTTTSLSSKSPERR